MLHTQTGLPCCRGWSETKMRDEVREEAGWDLGMYFLVFYFMFYADFGGPEHANLLNNRKLQKHQIHCNLLCFDFHKCPIFRPKCTPWLKPSTSLQPFFLFSARSDCPSPENFWLSIFHPPDIFISGKRPKTWFQWGAFYWFWTADWL